MPEQKVKKGRIVVDHAEYVTIKIPRELHDSLKNVIPEDKDTQKPKHSTSWLVQKLLFRGLNECISGRIPL